MKCKYCGFETSDKTLADTKLCQCIRCTAIRASGFCNSNHANAFRDELELDKRHVQC